MTKQEILSEITFALRRVYSETVELSPNEVEQPSYDVHYILVSAESRKVVCFLFDENSNRCMVHCLRPSEEKFDHWMRNWTKSGYGSAIMGHVTMIFTMVPLAENRFLITKSFFEAEDKKRECSIEELVSMIEEGLNSPLRFREE